jgi:hypothetical protein
MLAAIILGFNVGGFFLLLVLAIFSGFNFFFFTSIVGYSNPHLVNVNNNDHI